MDVRQYFSEIHQRGPRIIVVTNGAEGVYVATEETIYFHKSIPTDVINTVGAGDAFGSTFFGMLMQGADIQKAIAYGVINSSAALVGPDAQSSLLTRHELDQRYQVLHHDEYMQTIRWK
jgi:sugar/nucleoside kinase (ribokinase family)